MESTISKRLLAALERSKVRPSCFSDVFTFTSNSRVPGTLCEKCEYFKDCGTHVHETRGKIEALHRMGCFGDDVSHESLSSTTCKSCEISSDCARSIASKKLHAVAQKLRSPGIIAPGDDFTAGSRNSSSVAIRTTPTLPLSGPTLTTSSAIGTVYPAAPVAAARPTSAYRFPDENPKFQQLLELGRTKSVEQLIEWIEKLSHGKSAKGAGKPLPYEQVRDALCATSIALNEKGWPAPKFRPLRKPQRAIGLAAAEANLSNDRQVIDLHWLKKHEVVSATATHQALFEAPNFDFRRASHFVATVGKASLKAKVLGLTDRQQLVLGVLHSDEMRGRWRTIDAAVRRGDIALREYAERGKARLDKKNIATWMNAFKALAIAKGDITSARGVYQGITGKSISRGLMERRRQALERGGARLP